MKPWAEQFYNSDQWRDTREGFLESKLWLCERCGEAAKIAHHIIYLTVYNINDPYISLSWDNLESLCQDCHNKEHHKKESNSRYSFDEEGNLIPPISKKP